MDWDLVVGICLVIMLVLGVTVVLNKENAEFKESINQISLCRLEDKDMFKCCMAEELGTEYCLKNFG